MRIIRKAVQIGNGAAVYVPREYSGKEIVVLLPEGIEEIKKRVLSKLIDFMPNIIGVYLYGSYARKEEVKESDIDVFVIVNEKDENIKNALKDVDLRIAPIESVRRTIKNYPLLIMPILKEAQTLLNPALLEELKNSKIDLKKFKWSFDEIRRTVKIIEEFVKLDEEDISSSHIYSLMMRARVCSLIECLLENKKFSNEIVKKRLLEKGFDKEDIEKFFYIYREIREDKELKTKIRKKEILRLVTFIKEYSARLENETKKKIRKRN
ncbi:nucleotidyltransferase domain-containing protein [Candidatus Pacearchaeota archaeon]|nr:nucleotidyltransferase domain-containing protein [Candidatus Pacearchaeota archaeon]